VCLIAKMVEFPEGGGHFWPYLNWAMGLRRCGCEVIWLEPPQGAIPRLGYSLIR
jgi:hypothetical protein